MTKTKITSPNKGSAKRTKKIKSPAPEKRLKRFRSKPTIAIGSRIERAIQQRLFLVEVSSSTTCPHHGGPSITLNVLGSTGNVYEVTISKIPRCNCPDHTRGNLCKHLLFVMLKVVGLPVNSALVYQSAYLTNELDEILAMLQARTLRLGRDVVANEAVRQRHTDMKNGESADAVDSGTSLVQRKEVEGIDCPICFEELGTDLSQLTYCQQTCGTNFHSGCMQMWTGQAAQRVTIRHARTAVSHGWIRRQSHTIGRKMVDRTRMKGTRIWEIYKDSLLSGIHRHTIRMIGTTATRDVGVTKICIAFAGILFSCRVMKARHNMQKGS